jgi:hypothetical protein
MLLAVCYPLLCSVGCSLCLFQQLQFVAIQLVLHTTLHESHSLCDFAIYRDEVAGLLVAVVIHIKQMGGWEKMETTMHPCQHWRMEDTCPVETVLCECSPACVHAAAGFSIVSSVLLSMLCACAAMLALASITCMKAEICE